MTAFRAWPSACQLTSADLVLEPLRIEHAEELVTALDDPSLHTYTGGRPATLGRLRERYRRQVAGRSDDGAQLWFNWVLRARESRSAVGFVQATVSAPDEADEMEEADVVAEVAWVVSTGHQGRGYAAQAVATMVAWLRAQGAGRILAHIHPGHRASIRVAERIGMRPTDTTVDGEVRWTG